jgi:hypothetical protein
MHATQRSDRKGKRHPGHALMAAVLALSMVDGAQAAPPQPVWVGVWRGTVGEAPVQVCLQHADYGDFGAYYYLRHLGIISIGRLAKQEEWTEAPFSDKAAQGPLWHFSAVSGSRLQGTWSQGAKKLPFVLTPVPMPGASGDDMERPCGSKTFSLPRFTRPVITTRPASLRGVAYTRVLASPGKQFGDSATETFQLQGTTPAIRRVNAALYKPVPTGPEADYFTCSMQALGANGLDGDLSSTITPLIITADWMVLQDGEENACGGAHPNADVLYQSWDLRKGARINLYDWFTRAALTQTLHDANSKEPYVTVAFTAAFRKLIDETVPPGEAECGDALKEADTWNPRLTETGMAFTPELPHVVQACADDAEIPAARLMPYLTPEGRQAMTGFLAQVRLLPPPGKGAATR